MVARGGFDMPVIGVAHSGWTVDQLRERARDSLEHNGGVDAAAFEKLSSQLRYIDGDYNDAGTFERLRKALGGAEHPLHYLAIPPSLFATVVRARSEEHTSELQSLMRISYAVFCLKKKNKTVTPTHTTETPTNSKHNNNK